MNELFLRVALILVKINKGEIMEVDTCYKENIVDNYLSRIIRLIKEGVTDEYFEFNVDYEFGLITNNERHKENFDKLSTLKHLSKIIRNNDYESFLSFSRYFVDDIHYVKINTLIKINIAV